MNTHTNIDLVDTLRSERHRRRMSQSKLGSIVKMPQSHLARIETGVADLRLSTLTEIARALDLEPMLIPKSLVPAVRYMIDAPKHPLKNAPKLVGNAPDEPENESRERE
jgi:transcriptional regulator with XRE-family HTH domain